ncbi:MAG: hypothetical protein WCY87_03990 [Candidatus Cloacimonadales bacterium]|jgi:hypothetical protein|nr:hypothetical protein [Candidatus Cloacimonadota bacterium]MDY0381571.1 hypothetical protein [Candidatus Cloacimonadaceae bacterium]MCB5256886.1 hypothetical protein [Candidatus Cloacimonadota bacterium]MCB5264040.1 hypothetical protein [Candidatus Cloacimonadota bacterium]MCB5277180.1 hypothetical protein [Candidatus Cloacimonadota bacterium]
MKRALLPLLLLFIACSLSAIDVRNRFSLYALQQEDQHRIGAEWALDLQHESTWKSLTGQAGYSLHSNLQNTWEKRYTLQMDAHTYRWWLSLQAPQSELRLGLQQINFGSAQILRPLQWFDTLQVQDPYRISRGVDAVLFRHYWLNSANLWLWGILGEDSAKGNDFIPAKDNALEFGARMQYPSPIGEAAISAHTRELEQGREYRLGLDYRYDGAIGAWLETSAGHFIDALPYVPAYSASASLGMDYVFDRGNGIACTLENMLSGIAKDDLSGLCRESWTGALMINYPLALLDTVSLVALSDWDGNTYAINAGWRRVYDYVSLDLTLGHSSETQYLLQLMISLNL